MVLFAAHRISLTQRPILFAAHAFDFGAKRLDFTESLVLFVSYAVQLSSERVDGADGAFELLALRFARFDLFTHQRRICFRALEIRVKFINVLSEFALDRHQTFGPLFVERLRLALLLLDILSPTNVARRKVRIIRFPHVKQRRRAYGDLVPLQVSDTGDEHRGERHRERHDESRSGSLRRRLRRLLGLGLGLGLGFHRRRRLDLFPHGDVRVHIALSHDHARHRRWCHHPLKRPPRRVRARAPDAERHRHRHRARLGGPRRRVVPSHARREPSPRRRFRRYRRASIVIVTVRARDARARPRRSPRTNRASRLAAHPSRAIARAMRRPRAHRRRRDRHDVANTKAGARSSTVRVLARVASSRATTGGIHDDAGGWMIAIFAGNQHIHTVYPRTHTMESEEAHTTSHDRSGVGPFPERRRRRRQNEPP